MSDQTTPAPATTPWYKSDLFKWAAAIALGFALSWLRGIGITPAPIAPPPVVPTVNVFTLPATPATPPATAK